VDEGYDKKVYENTIGNIFFIIFIFFVYYILNSVIFYGQLAFGTCFTREWMWQAIALFLFTVAFVLAMLFSGRRANGKKALHEFY
jgi:hypothetical protein